MFFRRSKCSTLLLWLWLRRVSYLAVFLLSFSGQNLSSAATPDDPIDALAKIPSYFELTSAPGLESYQVTVETQGEVWKEIAQTLGKDRVRLMEYFRAPDDISLHLQNDGSALFMPGLFDPNRAIRILMDEWQTLQEKKTLSHFRKKGEIQSRFMEGRREIEILPREGVLLEQYRELGTEAALIRLYRIKAALDSASGRLLVLEIDKETRARSIGSPWKSDTLRHSFRYVFGYQNSQGRYHPKELTVWRDTSKEMRFLVDYIRVKNWDLPVSKQIEYRIGDRWESATLKYGDYRVNVALPDSVFESVEHKSRSGLAKANKLSLMAQRALEQGKIEEAKRRMEALIKLYPDTPQAKQAMIFLGGFEKKP